MTKPSIIFYLRPDLDNYYYLSGGQVATSNIPMPLSESLIEWKDVDLGFLRNDNSHGIFRQYSFPLTFTKAGATILRDVNETQGAEGVCVFEAHRLNTTTQAYDLVYRGDIDFSVAVDERLKFQVEVLDRGLEAALKAFEDTEYDIPVFDSDCVSAAMDGIKLRNTAFYTMSLYMPTTGSNLRARTVTPELNFATSESDIVVDVLQKVEASTDTQQNIAANSWFYKASFGGTVGVFFEAYIDITAVSSPPTPNDGLLVRIVRNRAGTLSFYTIYENTNSVTGGRYFVSAGKNVPVLPGDTLSIVIGVVPFISSTTAADLFYISITDANGGPGVGKFRIFYYFRLPSRSIKGYRYLTFLQKLIDKISPGATVQSDYLSNALLFDEGTMPYNALVTCGDALRGLGNFDGGNATKAPKIRATLADVRKDLLGRFGCSMGVEGNTLRVEKVAYFYQPGEVAVPGIGEVKNRKRTWDKEYLANGFKFGYKPNTYDNLNGRDEPNTTLTFTAPVTRSKNTLDYTAAFRCDMYGVEKIRANLTNKDTTDAESDNDVFVLEISAQTNINGAHLLARYQNDAGGIVSGLIAAETAYNLGYSPRRCIARLGPLLAVSCYKLDGKALSFQTADKNPSLVSKLGTGPTITETADIEVDSLPDALFMPAFDEFETIVPITLPDMVASNPYGLVPYTYNGGAYAGYIDNVGIHPADNAPYTFKLRPTLNS